MKEDQDSPDIPDSTEQIEPAVYLSDLLRAVRLRHAVAQRAYQIASDDAMQKRNIVDGINEVIRHLTITMKAMGMKGLVSEDGEIPF